MNTVTLDDDSIFFVAFDRGKLSLRMQNGETIIRIGVPEGEFIEMIDAPDPYKYFCKVIRDDYPGVSSGYH